MMDHNTAQQTKTLSTMSDTSEAETNIQTNLAKLPPELLFKIIARTNLSICSMVNTFPCSWHSIITHPLFLTYHHNDSPPQQSAVCLIVRKTDVYPNEFTLLHKDISLNKFVSTKLNKFDFVTDTQYHQLNPCHGLICFWKYDSNKDKDLFFLSNPSTAEWVKLPDAEPLPDHMILYNGFGYSPSTNQYKIVRIGGAGLVSPLKINVYTVGTSGWRTIKGDTIFQRFLFDRYFWFKRSDTSRHFSILPVEFNGFLHWFITPDSYRLICFDVGTEKLRTFQLPDFDRRYIPQIGVLNGRFILCVHRSNKEVMQIRVLKYDYDTKGHFTVELGEKLGDYYRGSSDWVQEIIDVDENENKCLMIHDFRQFSCCFEAKTKGFQNLNKVCGIDEESTLQSFVPGFLSPKHIMSLRLKKRKKKKRKKSI